MTPSLALLEVGAVVVVCGLVAPVQKGPRLGVALQVQTPRRELLLVVGLHRHLARHVRSHLQVKMAVEFNVRRVVKGNAKLVYKFVPDNSALLL